MIYSKNVYEIPIKFFVVCELEKIIISRHIYLSFLSKLRLWRCSWRIDKERLVCWSYGMGIWVTLLRSSLDKKCNTLS